MTFASPDPSSPRSRESALTIGTASIATEPLPRLTDWLLASSMRFPVVGVNYEEEKVMALVQSRDGVTPRGCRSASIAFASRSARQLHGSQLPIDSLSSALTLISFIFPTRMKPTHQRC